MRDCGIEAPVRPDGLKAPYPKASPCAMKADEICDPLLDIVVEDSTKGGRAHRRRYSSTAADQNKEVPMSMKFVPSGKSIAKILGLLLCGLDLHGGGAVVRAVRPTSITNWPRFGNRRLRIHRRLGCGGPRRPAAAPTATSAPCAGSVGSFNSYQYNSSASPTGSVSVFTPDPNDPFQAAIAGATAISTAPPSPDQCREQPLSAERYHGFIRNHRDDRSGIGRGHGCVGHATFGATGGGATGTLIWNLISVIPSIRTRALPSAAITATVAGASG